MNRIRTLLHCNDVSCLKGMRIAYGYRVLQEHDVGCTLWENVDMGKGGLMPVAKRCADGGAPCFWKGRARGASWP
jgi:hypothetical protein